MPQNDGVEWTIDGLRAVGFEGFVRLSGVAVDDAPPEEGIYAILRPVPAPPVFRPTSPAGRLDDRDPSVPLAELAEVWVPGAVVLYLGRANLDGADKRGLGERIAKLRDFGSGMPVRHWAGRYLWQLADSADLLVTWKPTPGQDSDDIRNVLIDDFAARFGKPPFANRTEGRIRAR